MSSRDAAATYEKRVAQALAEEASNGHVLLAPWQPLKADAFLQLPEPEGSELLGPLVLRAGRTLIGGDSGHGKTTLAFAMTAAIISGSELLGHTGAGEGKALIIDLEQGVRSIKRGIRAAGLDEADVHILNLPDGLALDRNPVELQALEDVIGRLCPAVIVLDPYYKAHRGDANEERAVTDLMRNLDRLRTEYLFALILPAHVRKDVQGGGVRKLTLADIAGSGAISRGAEVVLGLERLSHGQARMRYLKDREGELPVGEAIDLTYSHEEGFQVKEGPSSDSIEGAILAIENSDWMTYPEWARATGFRDAETKRVLERLAASGEIEFEIGPQGRSKRAKCYSTTTRPTLQDDSGRVGREGASEGGLVHSSQPPYVVGGWRDDSEHPEATRPAESDTSDDIPLP